MAHRPYARAPRCSQSQLAAGAAMRIFMQRAVAARVANLAATVPRRPMGGCARAAEAARSLPAALLAAPRGLTWAWWLLQLQAQALPHRRSAVTAVAAALAHRQLQLQAEEGGALEGLAATVAALTEVAVVLASTEAAAGRLAQARLMAAAGVAAQATSTQHTP